jgi:STE24 endopeptidase
MNFNSRVNEFAADRYALNLGMAEPLASGLIKISIENLGNMVPDPLYSMYHFSHPPLVERLRALKLKDKKS